MKQPIDNIQWLNVDELRANDYNPNVVFDPELKLLKFSLLKQGWIQPILITNDKEIIDGFHRHWLCKNDKEVRAMTEALVPVVMLELDEPQRMLLTIRINRAKGNHVAVKMHDIIETLVNKHGLDLPTIMKEIGASKGEIELLLMRDVFDKKNIKEHTYSKAWIPRKVV